MVKQRNIFRILPYKDVAGIHKWEVRMVKSKSEFFYIKEDAIRAGKSYAKSNKPSQLVIYKADGSIQEEYTYDNDPFPPRG